MRKRVYRFFLDYEKEEAWVNDMAAQGWHLKRTMVGYFMFEKGEPGQYIYRNELIKGKSQEYFDFLETMNIEFVSKFGVWAYYRKKKSEGPFELFSDSSSKIKYLTLISRLFIAVTFLNLLIGFINLYILLGESTEIILTTGVSSINFVIVIIMCTQILKVERRKKGLQRELHIFEA
ncbi:hypothetical protein ABE61_02950 [Lysinibacillus sphaericus]|uniref:DUF2812 domain-containing protein n=1 Tax=Lysinibacillus sphaericus TaxID=1421 RepID=UPI0018CEEEB7|nr:DUF2812 domain-containing protein [Lysinibacillus sphaericus]MBG9453053.1 hypothetical protein [Lysinibacillus sphaericus]MBG9477654.1 hypothetical protein [Lysinibacillus sphaericus]MBG9594319.1 hypothetical protein [Lysinibacillus sphaericus]